MRTIRFLMNTLRPTDVPGALPKFVLGGLIGVMSVCANAEFKDVGEDDGALIHWSQSCCILDNAVFSRSVYDNIFQCASQSESSCNLHI